MLTRRAHIPVIVALATALVFSPALWNGFVVWDDPANLVNNPHYRGLGWPQLRWMFTSVLMWHWIPLTWMTFGLDYLLWGMNPAGYHLTNLLLHSANAAVFYLVALRLLRVAMPGQPAATLSVGASAAALFFALHPLRVESVAWVTERRDVLSGFFFFLTILAYLKAHETEGRGRRTWLAGSAGFYALALASKSIVMTLPVVLILLDVYPLGRLGRRPRDWIAPGTRKVWAEKVPYLLLALAFAGIALYVVREGLTPLEKYPLSSRVAIALYSTWFYIGKTLLPVGLSPLYELPARVHLLEPRFLASAIAVGALTGGFWLLRRRWPAGLAVWVSYAVILAPVNGLVHAGHQLANDRYSYFSCLGWALLFGAGICALIRASACGRVNLWVTRLAGAVAAAWVLSLAGLTWQQVQVWRDGETLWTYAIALDPTCAICHNNFGTMLIAHHQHARAIEHFLQAVVLKPDYITAHGNLGMALLKVGRAAEAVKHFERVLEEYPRDTDVLSKLGLASIQARNPSEALEPLRRAIALNPTHLPARINLGIALAALDRPGEAVEQFRQAVAINPKDPLPRFDLALAYLALGDIAAARDEHETLKRLDPQVAGRLAPLLQRENNPRPRSP